MPATMYLYRCENAACSQRMRTFSSQQAPGSLQRAVVCIFCGKDLAFLKAGTDARLRENCPRCNDPRWVLASPRSETCKCMVCGYESAVTYGTSRDASGSTAHAGFYAHVTDGLKRVEVLYDGDFKSAVDGALAKLEAQLKTLLADVQQRRLRIATEDV